MKLVLLLSFCAAAVAIDSQVKSAIIAKHNECRGAVGQSQVTWDNNLATFAQQTADNLARTCQMEHTSSSQRKSIPGWSGKYAGENLAYGMDSRWSKSSITDLVTMAKQGCDGWCNERNFYDINRNKCQPGKVCGHYTQEVWDVSDKIGCGIAICPSKIYASYILACNYEAGGNMNGGKPYGRSDSGSNSGGVGGDSGASSGGACSPSTKTTKSRRKTIQTTVTCEGGCTVTKTKTIYPSGGWYSRTGYVC